MDSRRLGYGIGRYSHLHYSCTVFLPRIGVHVLYLRCFARLGRSRLPLSAPISCSDDHTYNTEQAKLTFVSTNLITVSPSTALPLQSEETIRIPST